MADTLGYAAGTWRLTVDGGVAEHRTGAAAELTALLAQDRPVFCMTGF